MFVYQPETLSKQHRLCFPLKGFDSGFCSAAFEEEEEEGFEPGIGPLIAKYFFFS